MNPFMLYLALISTPYSFATQLGYQQLRALQSDYPW